jgi:hypothetical protein
MNKPTHAQIAWEYLYKKQNWTIRIATMVTLFEMLLVSFNGWALIFKR